MQAGYRVTDWMRGMNAIRRDLHMLPPLLPPLRPRPLSAVMRDIARATVPALRPEDC